MSSTLYHPLRVVFNRHMPRWRPAPNQSRAQGRTMDIFDAFKTAQKERWASFVPLQAITMVSAARLVAHARIPPGARVLDVACGTGVVAVTAARAGARVTGLDLTPQLLHVARENSRIASVEIDWHEGDVEQLPFADETFDVVLSQFGHMFAPRPEVAVSEMLRVLVRGGTIAFSTWPPELFVGRMFGLVAQYQAPPPPGVSPPPLWGDATVIQERLGARVRDIAFDRAMVPVPALSAAHYRDMNERTSGSVVKLVESLAADDPARLAAFREDYDALVSQYFDQNTVRQDYLMTRATKI
jgi:2-polyprenyl-3-methyl-5-hydroxy-6-metoxy-1,4-benzoquinol methylase